MSERALPAVVEGGPGRRQRQALAQLVPFPGHLAELEEHGVQVVPRRPVVVHGRWGRGGGLAVHGRTYRREGETEGERDGGRERWRERETEGGRDGGRERQRERETEPERQRESRRNRESEKDGRGREKGEGERDLVDARRRGWQDRKDNMFVVQGGLVSIHTHPHPQLEPRIRLHFSRRQMS